MLKQQQLFLQWQVEMHNKVCSTRPFLVVCFLSFLKKWPTPASYSFIFGLCKQTIQVLQQINAKNVMSIQLCQDSNPQSFNHASSPITTRPGLSPLFLGFQSDQHLLNARGCIQSKLALNNSIWAGKGDIILQKSVLTYNWQVQVSDVVYAASRIVVFFCEQNFKEFNFFPECGEQVKSSLKCLSG